MSLMIAGRQSEKLDYEKFCNQNEGYEESKYRKQVVEDIRLVEDILLNRLKDQASEICNFEGHPIIAD